MRKNVKKSRTMIFQMLAVKANYHVETLSYIITYINIKIQSKQYRFCKNTYKDTHQAL